MATTVAAFIGENANGILDVQSQRFLALMDGMGLQGAVIDVMDPGFADQLEVLLKQGLLFAWGYAGVGAQLAVQGRNLWETFGVPFVSALADAPYIMPTNHHVPSPWVVNGYYYRDWLNLQEATIRSPQVSALLQLGVVPNPARDDVAWSARPMGMLFVKGGSDPARLRAGWSGWPARLRAVLHDCADTLSNVGTGPIAPTVIACLAAHDVVLDGAKPLLFGLMSEIDTYIRALRATRMALALLPLPADIVGGGWEHVAHLGGRARFHPAIHAAELDPLYAQTQILLNVTPNFGSGAHERVLRGFAARCRVVSDDNDFSRANLHGLPSYAGVEWHAPDLTDRLAALFNDEARFDGRTDEALDYVETHHDPVNFINGMRDLADLARLHPTLSCYALDAA